MQDLDLHLDILVDMANQLEGFFNGEQVCPYALLLGATSLEGLAHSCAEHEEFASLVISSISVCVEAEEFTFQINSSCAKTSLLHLANIVQGMSSFKLELDVHHNHVMSTLFFSNTFLPQLEAFLNSMQETPNT